VLQCIAVFCNVLQCIAMYCNVLQVAVMMVGVVAGDLDVCAYVSVCVMCVRVYVCVVAVVFVLLQLHKSCCSASC